MTYVLKVEGLGKSFGAENIFHNVSFAVKPGEKVGLVGANGSGKTTMLKILIGEEEADGGSAAFSPGISFGYAAQQADFGDGNLHDEFRLAFSDILALQKEKEILENNLEDGENLARYEKVVAAFEHLEGYDYESRLMKVARGLGFTDEDLEKKVKTFSGGQKTRICLAKMLLREPDILLLDEPTNHLDIQMIEWLEDFLLHFSGAVLMISHDRFFLDKTSTKILELSGKTVTCYNGNYSSYMKQKEERMASLASAYEKQQEEIKRTEDFIRRYRAGVKAKQARGRESRLKRMPRLVMPPKDNVFAGFSFLAPPEGANRVAEFLDVTMEFEGKKLFENVNLTIMNKDGIALVGPNGAGKTTLLRILLGELQPTRGEVKIGSRIKIGYFSQQHEGLHPENTVLEEIMYEYGTAEDSARNLLGAFLFRGDDVLKKVGSLSGGEQSRLAFLKLLLTGANFLVLDEPTNHLDIPAKEAVEYALLSFGGTFLVVSHDRYFLDKVTNSTFELDRGVLREYMGSYSDYRAKKQEESEALEKGGEKNFAKVTVPKQAKESQGNREKNSPRSKKEIKLAKGDSLDRVEAQIAMAEAELKGLEITMNDPSVQGDPNESMKIAEEYAAKEKEISNLYEKWEYLCSGEDVF